MTDAAIEKRPPPKSLDDIFSAILSDCGLTEEEVARLERTELAQDSKERMWAVGKPTPIAHPTIAQTTALVFLEGSEVRVYSIPTASLTTVGFSIWRFRTDQRGFRFSLLPMETWMLMVGREFERQLDELDGEESEAEAILEYIAGLHPATGAATILAALRLGKHLPEDDAEEPEPKADPKPAPDPNGSAATVTPPAS